MSGSTLTRGPFKAQGGSSPSNGGTILFEQTSNVSKRISSRSGIDFEALEESIEAHGSEQISSFNESLNEWNSRGKELNNDWDTSSSNKSVTVISQSNESVISQF